MIEHALAETRSAGPRQGDQSGGGLWWTVPAGPKAYYCESEGPQLGAAFC